MEECIREVEGGNGGMCWRRGTEGGDVGIWWRVLECTRERGKRVNGRIWEKSIEQMKICGGGMLRRRRIKSEGEDPRKKTEEDKLAM